MFRPRTPLRSGTTADARSPAMAVAGGPRRRGSTDRLDEVVHGDGLIPARDLRARLDAHEPLGDCHGFCSGERRDGFRRPSRALPTPRGGRGFRLDGESTENASAIGRSGPSLRRSAGARLTVIRRSGNSSRPTRSRLHTMLRLPGARSAFDTRSWAPCARCLGLDTARLEADVCDGARDTLLLDRSAPGIAPTL